MCCQGQDRFKLQKRMNILYHEPIVFDLVVERGNIRGNFGFVHDFFGAKEG